MIDNRIYNDKFHEKRNELTRYAAETVVEFLMSIVPINSVCDVGGGVGVWVDEVKKQSSGRYKKGIVLDGAYVPAGQRLVEKSEFIECDLTDRINLNEKFDLAISLEVAEHLPEVRANTFIEDIVSLSDIILFSAAIPGQGGKGHINEQPISYWVDLFKKNGYEAFDIIRPRIQAIKKIPSWYRNNTIIYCNKNSELINVLKNVQVEPMYDWVLSESFSNVSQKLQAYQESKTYKKVSKILDIYAKIVKRNNKRDLP
ncbi:MAG: hypothetical protein PUI46_10415 [Lachnospiraceae bacterium]|nr:hypothetical protein [Lachnospiraceae bacterium]